MATHCSILAWRIPQTVILWSHKEQDTTEGLSLSESHQNLSEEELEAHIKTTLSMFTVIMSIQCSQNKLDLIFTKERILRDYLNSYVVFIKNSHFKNSFRHYYIQVHGTHSSYQINQYSEWRKSGNQSMLNCTQLPSPLSESSHKETNFLLGILRLLNTWRGPGQPSPRLSNISSFT